MKKAVFILIILLSFGVVSKAQKTSDNDYTIKVESIEALKKVKWNKITKAFKNNAPGDSINITVLYNTPDQTDEEKQEVNLTGNFKITRSCLASEVEDAVEDIKESSLALIEFKKKLNKKSKQ